MAPVHREWVLGDLALAGFEVPEGWAEVALEEVVVHALSGEWGQPDEGESPPGWERVRVLRGLDFKAWPVERGAGAARRRVPEKSLEKRRLCPGDIVVEVSGGGANQPVGRTLLIDEAAVAEGFPLICSNFCRQLRIHPEVDAAFVRLALHHQYQCGRFNEFQTQTTSIRNLDFSAFLSGVTLCLPPLGEQRRIVARLEELLSRVERARTAVVGVPANLRRLRLSALAAAGSGALTAGWRAEREGDGDEGDGEPFAERCEQALAERRRAYAQACAEAARAGRRAPRRPASLVPSTPRVPEPLSAPEVPPGWSLVALRDLLVRVQQGTSIKAAADPHEGVPILRMVNVRDGGLDLSDLKYVSPAAVDLAAFSLARRDVLFNRTNSPELVGKAAVFDSDLPAVFASYLVRLTCDERLVLPEYLAAWINSPWGRAWARTVKTDCVSQSNINAAKLLSMPVPVPPLAEQREIARRVEEERDLAASIEAQLERSIECTELLALTLGARALRGELVEPEADLAHREGRQFEPAAALLARVRAEREESGGHGVRPVRRHARRRRPFAAGSSTAWRASIAECSQEAILRAFRNVCWRAGSMSEEELLQGASERLGFSRLGKRVRSRLTDQLATALNRRILARDGDLLYGPNQTFDCYDYEFLAKVLLAVMSRGTEYERPDVVRAVVLYLGFEQITPAMRKRMGAVFQAAILCGVLGSRGGRVWRKR
jgi:type I restriction enzyme, S subunit